MLKIYHSNRLEALLPHLARELVDAPADPFQPEVILVQNPGMAQWLKLQIAAMFSVSANIEFPLPSTFIWRIFRQVLSDLPERSAFVKESMVWKLMALLPGHLEEEHFEPLNNYLQDDCDQRKRYQVAQKIADIFDQYLVYRPEWINAWERGEDLSEASKRGHYWQPLLWQALVNHTKLLGQSPYHRANLFEKSAERLLSSDITLTGLPERLFVFGISTLAPNYLKVLEALSTKVDIHLMVFNPCMHYWGDVMDPKSQNKMQVVWQKHNISPETYLQNANSLLASMAQQGRDYLDLLHECDAVDVDAFLPQNKPSSLLQLIQQDVLTLFNRGSVELTPEVLLHSGHKTTIDTGDRSIIFHSCYSAVREVEVLHEQLLALFDKDPTLTPKDIVVMMADVDSYTPYIQAIFNNAASNSKEKQFIPWAISDRSVKAESPILIAFLSLLQLPNSRCTVSEIFDLLIVPAVARRFELAESEHSKLLQWVQGAGVRWGIDGESKKQFNLPATEQNSWSFGLKRLLLGYAMPEKLGAFSGVMPFDGVEGSDGVVLGKLFTFIDELEKIQHQLRNARKLSQWSLLINELLEQFFLPKEEEEYTLQIIRDQLSEISAQIDSADFDETISYEVFVEIVQSALQAQSGGQRFLAGQVNFCTLMPMRSIPFKVVYLLGMNDGVYPRSVEPMGFDLMAGDYRKGDRSRRDDDRYLFLEALLSARQKIILSYQGRSARDNSERMPSVLVSELLEYCQQGFILEGDGSLTSKESARKVADFLLVEHPLQAFNRLYFSGGSKHYSYSQHWLESAKALEYRAKDEADKKRNFCEEPLPESEEHTTDYLEIDQLIRFYRNPSQYFLNHRLGVYFYSDETELIDEEPFQLDSLQKYKIKEQWLAHHFAGLSSEDFIAEQVLRGELPVGSFGRQSINQVIDGLDSMLERLSCYQLSEFESRDVQVELNDLVLTGRVDQVTRDGLLRYRPSEFKGKDKISLWINHLALSAMGWDSYTSRFVGQKKTVCLRPVSSDFAKDKLQQLVDRYFLGLQKPLAFFPETSYVAYSPVYKDSDKQIDDMTKAYTGNDYLDIPGDGSDAYISRCFNKFDGWPDEFFTVANDIFNGFHELMEEES